MSSPVCPKCLNRTTPYDAQGKHDPTDHARCTVCAYIFPIYGTCAMCSEYYSDEANKKRIDNRILSARIRQEFRTLGGMKSKARAAARKLKEENSK